MSSAPFPNRSASSPRPAPADSEAATRRPARPASLRARPTIDPLTDLLPGVRRAIDPSYEEDFAALEALDDAGRALDNLVAGGDSAPATGPRTDSETGHETGPETGAARSARRRSAAPRRASDFEPGPDGADLQDLGGLDLPF